MLGFTFIINDMHILYIRQRPPIVCLCVCVCIYSFGVFPVSCQFVRFAPVHSVLAFCSEKTFKRFLLLTTAVYP